MICRICGEDINEKGQDNISPICDYPICEDCKDEIACESCYETHDIYYVEEFDKILCKQCLLKKAEKAGYINTYTVYCNEDWNAICNDGDTTPAIEYLERKLYMQEINNDR